MKKSDEITEKNEEFTSWTWLLNLMLSLFSNQNVSEKTDLPLKEVNASMVQFEVFQVVFKQLFKNTLSKDILLRISRYLPFQPNKNEKTRLLANQSSVMFAFDTRYAREVGYAEYLYAKFQYLIAKEGEDNQNQAEKILKRLQNTNTKLLQRLISGQGDIRDAAGRHFVKPMSTYEYAFWAGDTRMCRMLEKYMDEEIKAKVLQQCKHINEHGIDFIFKRELIQNSKNFNFDSLILAYTEYISAVYSFENGINLSNESCELLETLWLNIGKELAKVPTHIAQEYCSNISFVPLEDLRNKLNNMDINRTVKFSTKISYKPESWFIGEEVYLNLGVWFAIIKSGSIALACQWYDGYWNYTVDVANNLEALKGLCEVRIDIDRKQTLENLKPLFPKMSI